jgi:serine/threonine protein kinase
VLHELGVVHRDVKPQNLLLRSGGSTGDRLLVADLGVAKAMLHASGLTQVVGTPAYMAPEQVTGEGIDTRADVHALAAVAYHLLTGRLARTGSVAGPPRPGVPVLLTLLCLLVLGAAFAASYAVTAVLR